MTKNSQNPNFISCLAWAVILLLCWPISTTAQTIYRHVDAQGNITFSDEPPTDDSEVIHLEEVPTVSLPRPRAQPSPTRDSPARDQTRGAGQPPEVRITSPEHDSSFWAPGGDYSVEASLSDPLPPGWSLGLDIDGVRIGQSASGNFTVTNVNRGTQEAVVHVLNAQGDIMGTSSTVRFTVHRPSVAQ